MEGRNLTANQKSESQEDIHLILEFSVPQRNTLPDGKKQNRLSIQKTCYRKDASNLFVGTTFSLLLQAEIQVWLGGHRCFYRIRESLLL